MHRWITNIALCCLIVAVAACGGEKESSQEVATDTQEAQQKEPDYITVQHILIAFEGTIPGKPITRSQEEADKLANEVFKRATSGEDFDALVKEFTDDSHPGIYKMANHGAQADMSQRIFPRAQMVAAFGDVGFPLAVGEIGLAAYDPVKSKYGWHIIKRVE